MNQEQANRALTHFEKLQSDQAKSDYLRLVLAGCRAGYDVTPDMSTTVTWGIRFHKDSAQPFAFIVNRDDMLFYVRGPALAADPSLEAKASQYFPDAGRNNGGEVTFHVRGDEQVSQLISWLF